MSQQASQTYQAAQPTLFNLPPQPQSTPDTPSEVPGTPTSTTTSLSAISTTALKDGQRGVHIPPLVLDGGGFRGAGIPGGNSSNQRFGHQHSPSINSLEAERADRISRLAGLSGVSTLRPMYAPNRGSAASVTSGSGGGNNNNNNNNGSNRFSGSGVLFATTPTSTSGGGFGALGLLSNNMAVPGPLTPAFFDAHGQPVAITKMSTVGTASATDSISGRTFDDNSTADGETTTEDGDTDGSVDDDDIKSLGTNYQYSNSRRGGGGDGDAMMMDDDNTSRSVGGYEDRMSDDDGSASLVGFGEGAGSTVSGPIYHRRPLPPYSGSSAGAMAANHVHNNSSSSGGGGGGGGHIAAWGSLERTNSGLSDVAIMGSASGSMAGAAGGPRRGDYIRSPLERLRDGGGSGSEYPFAGSSNTGGGVSPSAHMAMDDDVFVDNPSNGTATGGRSTDATGWPVIQAHPSALRETQRPRSHQQQQQTQYYHHHHNNNNNHHHHHHHHSISYQYSRMSREREAAEQILQGMARYDGQESPAARLAANGPSSSGLGGPLEKLSKGDSR